MKKVLVILGPTASGKSDLGVRLAKKFKGEIISADSRQVYKGLNVGSGKITRKEMRGVKHYMLDVLEPQKYFSVAQYQTLAQASLDHVLNNGKLPMIVGGTGFYIDALAGGIVLPEVPPNPKLRAKLARKSNTALFKMLRELDPKRAKNIDPQNKVRLIRALEIVEKLGKVPPLRQGFAGQAPNKFVWIGLLPEDLDQRIEKRLTKRMPSMIREARKLLKQKKLTYKRMHELGLEYRYLALYLQGKLDKLEMFNKLNTEIRRYSKRQMTWFRYNKKIKWFTLSSVEGFKPSQYKEIEKYLKSKL